MSKPVPPSDGLKFIGTANLNEASIGIYGDGISKDITLNLTKAPFNIDWKGFYPKHINVENIGASTVKTVDLNGNNLIIIFEEAPPAPDWGALADPLAPFPKPSRSFKVYFIYGAGP